MAITVGTDTYISVDDADAYVDAHYVSTHAKSIAWEMLKDADKEIYLRNAARTIDRQPLIGQKATTQTMEFPRAIYIGLSAGYDVHTTALIYGADWYVESEVTDEVKYAQVEIALTECAGLSARQEMMRDGVKSFSIGNLSENYGSGARSKIVSTEANEYLAKYLAGSVRIA
jgi:hypothetical protein